MKILVTGGRKYGQKTKDTLEGQIWVDDPIAIAYLNDTLDAIHAKKPITCVIHGGASGADTLAKQWAISHGIEQKEYLADWSYGRVAGPLRNAHMLDQNKDIKCVIAFPGGAGTKNCCQLARSRNVNVLLCEG